MSITFDQSRMTFYLEGRGFTYAFAVGRGGYLEHRYFGARIGRDDLSFASGTGMGSFPSFFLDKDGKRTMAYNYLPTELSFFGTGDYREPTVKVTFPDGSKLVQLLYDGYEILSGKPAVCGMPSLRGGETLVVHLSDRINHFACDLYYTVYDDCGVVARRAVYKNGGDCAVTLDRAYSFCMTLPGNAYDVIDLYGGWARERQIERKPLHRGIFTVDSKRATSSSELNPFMAIVESGATEDRGDAYGVNLIYSSSYVLKAEGIADGNLLLTGGINDFDFSWRLCAGESFETPEAVIAYSENGIGGMSRELHDAYRNHLINQRFVKAKRPIVINNWEGTSFNFTTQKLKDIVGAIAGTGVDTFVLDDGWFGVRNNDKSGLGDWFVNTDKLEGGLEAIIDYTHEKGMKFGLWFEPEMISEDSDLFRAHPDYAIGVPGRQRCYGRMQYMLDITRQDVRDYVVEAVNGIIRGKKVDYVKWDYNRNVTEFYSLGLDADRQKEFSHRYALGLYELCERIVEANPSVFFEGCSGGGARFDPAMLYYFPQIWTSDDTDAEERTLIQYGTSLAYPLSAMSCHVSAVPNHQSGRTIDIGTRADIAHLGATGYELDTSDFTDEDRDTVRAQVEEYEAMERLVIEGDLYRTENPFEDNFFGFMLVSKDKSRAVLTAYRRIGRPNREIKRLRVAGLDKDRTYRVSGHEIDAKGSTLMRMGIPFRGVSGDFKTLKFTFTAID